MENVSQHAWVLAARGPQPTSFRAEGYALFSLVLYLRRVAEFTSMHEPWIGAIATNSKSLLQTLKSKPTTPIHPALDDPILLEGKAVRLDVLQPDGDVLIKIQYGAMTHLPEIKLQFIRGHQDCSSQFARLYLLAQLNVEADSMTTSYQNTMQRIAVLSPCRLGPELT
jgi:hypothetical protein